MGLMPHWSLAVANRFLEMARKNKRELTPMHLQKLVYIAHGWSLAINGHPLTRDRIEAWPWGPVYPDLYDALKRYGPNSVNDMIHENNWAIFEHIKGDIVREDFDPEDESVIQAVFKSYGDLHAFQLSALTHNDGTPWDTVMKKEGDRASIPDKLIEDHFRKIAGVDA